MIIKVILFLVIYIVAGVLLDLITRDPDEDLALSIICVVMWPAIFAFLILGFIVSKLYDLLRRKWRWMVK